MALNSFRERCSNVLSAALYSVLCQIKMEILPIIMVFIFANEVQKQGIKHWSRLDHQPLLRGKPDSREQPKSSLTLE